MLLSPEFPIRFQEPNNGRQSFPTRHAYTEENPPLHAWIVTVLTLQACKYKGLFQRRRNSEVQTNESSRKTRGFFFFPRRPRPGCRGNRGRLTGTRGNKHLAGIRHSLFGSRAIKYSAAKRAPHPHLPRRRFPFFACLISGCRSSGRQTRASFKIHFIRDKSCI